MSFNGWVRQIHRWLSIVITLGFIFNIVASLMKKEAVWMGLFVLVPLILMLITGLYLFALPYIDGKGQRSSGGELHAG